MSIVSFVHKGLERFAKTGDTSGIRPGHAQKLNLLLTQLSFSDGALGSLSEIPGFHPVKRKFRSEIWCVKVNASWRLTFRIENGSVCDLDYVQYH